VAKPVVKPAPKPVAKPAAKPVAKPAAKPVLVAKPAAVAHVPAKPPPVKATPEPVKKPAPRPVAKPKPKPAPKPKPTSVPSRPPGAKPTTPVASKPVTGSSYQLDATQQANAGTILAEGSKLNAPRLALIASMYAAIGETALGTNPKTYVDNGSGYTGVLQGSMSAWPDPHDITGQAQAFFTGTGPQGQTDFHIGAINLANQGVTNPAEIAVRVEVPSIWPADAYAKEFDGGEAGGIADATAIVDAYLKGTPTGSGFAGGGASPPAVEKTLKGTGTFAGLIPLTDSAHDISGAFTAIQSGATSAAHVSSATAQKITKLVSVKAATVKG
jgi:hypothetical protein